MFNEYITDLRKSGKRAFTFQQVMNELNASLDSIKSGLYRLKKEGKIISPVKGLYIIVPPEHQIQGSIPAEEMIPILMNYIKADYYVSLLSGAQYYGASHQRPSQFQVITNKRIKHSLKFGQVKIQLIYKKILKQLPIQEFIVNTGYLKVATPELIVYDLLTYVNKSGGLNHIATVLSELIESLDADNLIKLAQQLGERTWLQRLGFILEQIEPMDEEKVNFLISKLAQYLYDKMNFFVPLASELPKKGYPRIKKWQIIANTNIESDL